ncbi:MAG: hypothetical protein M3680_22955, partial [Myxococcota bacterium]|nr:hypothetical protein [Myxococcota bacterium]
IAAATPPPPSSPSCITPVDDAAPITHARVDGSRVQYCIGTGTDQCFALDTESGAFMRLPEPPAPATRTGARVETTNPELKVCQSETCKTLTPNILPAAASIRAATNEDGSYAVFLLGDAPAGKGYAEIWDVARRKRVTLFRYARGEFKCGDVAVLGNTIYLATAACGSPAARAALYTLKGKRIASVGGRDFGVFGNAHAQVDGSTWAFLEENGSQLVIQDVAKGKVVKTIDTSALFKDGGSPMGNPGESALVRIAPGTLAVIGGAPALGNVATVEVATGAVKVLRATVCDGS